MCLTPAAGARTQFNLEEFDTNAGAANPWSI